MKPHIPVWTAQGNKIIEEWTEDNLYSGTRKYKRIVVKYLDSKGRMQVATKQVVWEE